MGGTYLRVGFLQKCCEFMLLKAGQSLCCSRFPCLGHLCKLVHTGVAVFSPEAAKAIIFIPLCQLFGGKSPPLNFARYAGWLCEVSASLFALPASHCVDDVISVEPGELAESGNLAFRVLCTTTGCAISAGKPPRRPIRSPLSAWSSTWRVFRTVKQC